MLLNVLSELIISNKVYQIPTKQTPRRQTKSSAIITVKTKNFFFCDKNEYFLQKAYLVFFLQALSLAFRARDKKSEKSKRKRPSSKPI